MGLRLKLLLPLLLLAVLAGGYLMFRWVPGYVALEMQDRRALLLSYMEFTHHELLEHAQQGDHTEVRAHMLALIGTYPNVRRLVLNDPINAIKLVESAGADAGQSTAGLETLTVPDHAGPSESTLTLYWDKRHDQAAAEGRVQDLQAVIAGLIAAVLLSAYLLLEYHVRRPVLRLALATRRLAGGDTRVPLPATDGDEIGALVNDFARMRDGLAASRQALVDARDSLDAQVHARTEELEGANHALYAEVSERRTIENELQQALSELRQQKQVIDLHAIVSIADKSGRITYANDKFCEVSGYSRKELLGQDHRLLNSGCHAPGFFREMWSIIGHGNVWRGEVCNRSKLGELYWVDSTIVPFLDENGKPYQYISIRTEITQIKNYEAQQQARAQRLHEQQLALLELARYPALVDGDLDAALRRITRIAAHMLGCIYAGIWRFDAARKHLVVDVEYQLSGTEHELGESLEVASYPHYFKLLGQQRCIAVSDVYTDPRLEEFGIEYFQHAGVTATLDAPIYWNGRCIGLLCLEHSGGMREWHSDEEQFAASLADMAALALHNAQRHTAEQALRLSEARFKGIAESMSDWIWEVDAQGQYTWCSSGVEHLLGVRAEDMVGRSIFDWLSTTSRQDAQQVFARAAAMRQPFKDIEICVTGSDGRRTCLLMSGIPLIDGNGALTGYAGVCLDISTRKETEHMLERARDTAMEALRMKTEFLANVSHEVRTPLHGMLGLLGLLRGASLEPREQEYVELAHGAGESLLALVNNILDFSRLETRGLVIEEAPFEPATVIDEVMQLHGGTASMKGLRLERRIDPETHGLWRGDPMRLSQVLGNLLNNAIKFTQTGSVTLSVEVATDGGLRFSVRDTGPGITPEYQTRVFEPFVQGDGSSTRVEGGSGLGLAICKQLVERMGGCIGVESMPGAGSCFWVALPWPREMQRQQVCCSPQ